MSVLKCSVCSKEVNENENFELLCQESEDIEWACKKCLFKALLFFNCPKKVLNSLSYKSKRNGSGVNLNPSYLNKLFSNPDSAKSGLFHKQFQDNIIDEPIKFADNNYILSENVHNLTKEMSRNSTIILMHLNIRSLPQNFDKLKILLLSMKIKPHVNSLNETSIKNGHIIARKLISFMTAFFHFSLF